MMASVSRILPKNMFPSPSPLLAPFTKPAMSTISMVVGTIRSGFTNSASLFSRSSGTVMVPTLGSMVQNGKFADCAFAFERQLKRVDLPTLGKPTIPHFRAMYSNLGAKVRIASVAIRTRRPRDAFRRRAGVFWVFVGVARLFRHLQPEPFHSNGAMLRRRSEPRSFTGRLRRLVTLYRFSGFLVLRDARGDDADALTQFIFRHDKWRREPNDVSVGGLGHQTIVFHRQADVPRRVAFRRIVDDDCIEQTPAANQFHQVVGGDEFVHFFTENFSEATRFFRQVFVQHHVEGSHGHRTSQWIATVGGTMRSG